MREAINHRLLCTGSWLSLILLVVGVVLIVVCVVLWIAVWAVVAPQDSKSIIKLGVVVMTDSLQIPVIHPGSPGGIV